MKPLKQLAQLTQLTQTNRREFLAKTPLLTGARALTPVDYGTLRRVILPAVLAFVVPGAALAQGLTRTPIPDGSGSIGVARHWKMTSGANGSASLAGPGGAAVNVGMVSIVTCPNPERAMNLGTAIPGGAFPGVPRVRFSDPVAAEIDFARFVSRRAAAQGFDFHLTSIQAVQYTPWQNGRAAFIHFRSMFKGKTYETFGLYAIMPVSPTQATFYASEVAAPVSSFKGLAPTMMAMWNSWGLSKGTINARLASAAATVAGIDYTGSAASSAENRRVAEKAARKWDDVIRDDYNRKGARKDWNDPDLPQ